MPQPIDVILDCDTGTDDAVAIMLAALSPRINLLAVTTVNGNVPTEVVTENTLRVLSHIDRADVAVYEGARHPLHRDDFPVPRDKNMTFPMHGTYLDLPPSGGERQPEDAVEYLCRKVRAGAKADRAVTLVATGPLTNIAACVERDPDFVAGVATLIVMGGGHAIGNVTPSAEFNFWADPEAAKIVVGAGFRDLVIVPLDATHRALVSLADCAALRGLGTPAGDATAMVIEQRIHAHDASQPMEHRGTAPVHDALCVALLLDDGVVELARLHVDVETTGDLTVGRSVIDVHHRSGKPANARVALGAAPERFVALLLKTFSPRAR
ncbi:MAG TPA: nucleoside hydrolase [Galbitalea sp.]|nr:nucleoside hydrolase [Galbitalea sp.]